jgi:hypothetical protein
MKFNELVKLDQSAVGKALLAHAKKLREETEPNATLARVYDDAVSNGIFDDLPIYPGDETMLIETVKIRKEELEKRAADGDIFAQRLIEYREKTGTESGLLAEPAE